MRTVLFIVVALCALSADGSAWAVPAPMSPQELMAASDLVALVRVLSVTCVAIIHHGREELCRYSAELGVLRVRKGPCRRYDTVSLEWEEVPGDVVGPWYVAYYAGGKGWTHLKGQEGLYETTWWNATDDWHRRGNPRLPQDLMETRRVLFLFRLPFLVVKGWRALRRGWETGSLEA
jgi:hypothetical protein